MALFLSFPARIFLNLLHNLSMKDIGRNEEPFPCSFDFLRLEDYPTDWNKVSIFKKLKVKYFLMHLEDDVVDSLFAYMELHMTRTGQVYSPLPQI